MSNIIDSIRMSGTTYAISDSGGTKVVEITQSDYDNLPTSAKTANIMYVITDAEPIDVSNYYTKSETSGATELATAFAATQPKLSAGTNITIDANNVISAEGGGGKAVVGGRGITVTSGETADTVSFNLPISAGTQSTNLIIGEATNISNSARSIATGYKTKAQQNNAFAQGYKTDAGQEQSHAEGYETKAYGVNSHSEGRGTSAMTLGSHAEGLNTITSNSYEHTQGQYNVSNKANTTFGDSGNTLFSVGNGTSNSARHNAFEIRQDGSIFITSGGTDIKLQDHLGGGGIDSGTVQTMIDQSISGKTNQTDFVSHSGNTTMHVTASEKSTWNNKSDFSGNYNDLSNKPTIPTSASQLTNDSGYITSSALDGYATEAYVTAATNDMATKTWVGQQGYLTQHQDISGKQDVSGMTAYTTTATTNTLSGTVTAHTADTTIHVTSAEKATWNAKSDFSGDYNDLSNKLSAGTNITIVDNVISAESGGGGKAVSGGTNISITTGETADTINCTLPIREGSHSSNKGIIVGDSECSSTGSYSISFGHNADAGGSYSLCMGSNSSCNGQQSIVIGDGSSNNGSDFTYCFGRNLHPNRVYQFLEGANLHNNNEYEVAFGQYNVSSRSNYNYGYSGNTLFSIGNGYDFSSTHNWHNALEIRQNGDIYVPNTDDTSVTGDKAYSLYPMVRLQDTITATAANTTALGGLKLVKLSQSEYDSLATKDNSTLYVIVN